MKDWLLIATAVVCLLLGCVLLLGIAAGVRQADQLDLGPISLLFDTRGYVHILWRRHTFTYVSPVVSGPLSIAALGAGAWCIVVVQRSRRRRQRRAEAAARYGGQ